MPFIEIGGEKGLDYAISRRDPSCLASAVFLHGLMGQKGNLKTFIEKWMDEIPKVEALSFDLRNHGRSSKKWSPFTIEACADDIVNACQKLEIEPQAIIGHSFGGKVAIAAAKKLMSVLQVWMLDCPPGRLSPHGHAAQDVFNAHEMIKALTSIRWPLASRQQLIDELIHLGIARNAAFFMTTNTRVESDGLYLVFDPLDLQKMLEDFMSYDCWPMIKGLCHRAAIHLVSAEHGQRVDQNDGERLAKMAPKDRGFFHVLQNSGHLVHIDNPKGLIALMKCFFLF